MIFNLDDELPDCLVEKASDVCIVGAGTAGIYLSQALEQRKINVTLIELGGNSIVNADSVFDKPSFIADNYRGASLGRVAGLGGTSAKWGGQMISLSNVDFLKKDDLNNNAGWSINNNDLNHYYEKVLTTLNMSDPDAYNFSENKTAKLISRSSVGDSFRLRSSKWIPFKKRNFAKGFRNILTKSKYLEVWINAQFRTMDDAEWRDSSLKKLTFSGNEGRTLVVSSKLFVFTMGALESTRHILPLSNKSSNFESAAMPFCDHLSTTVGYLKIKNKRLFLDYFSPFYTRGIMRSLRFELDEKAQDRLNTASAFVHFVTVHDPGSALNIVRNLARKLQGEKVSFDFSNIKPFGILKDILLIIFWRVFRRKLILNHGGSIEVVIDIEQTPNKTNKIWTSSDELKINWTVGEDDKSTLKKTAKEFLSGWRSSKELSDLAELVVYPESELNIANYYDVYHPTGSLPFGDNPNSSVLNKDLRVWGISNLYVSSTAIFPTGGSANPGLTHLALTERLADHITSHVADN